MFSAFYKFDHQVLSLISRRENIYFKNTEDLFLSCNDNFEIIKFLSMLESLGQPVIFLPLLSLCSHQKESYKQQKLILLWILLWAATSQGISLLYVSLESSWGKVLHEARITLCAELYVEGLTQWKLQLPWCGQVYERHHYYFSNYTGFLEMYLFVPLNDLFSLFVHQKTKHSCVCKLHESFICRYRRTNSTLENHF